MIRWILLFALGALVVVEMIGLFYAEHCGNRGAAFIFQVGLIAVCICFLLVSRDIQRIS